MPNSSQNISVRNHAMVWAALCAALTCVIAPWSIPIGPVSLTLSVFAVLFTGAILTPGWAFAAQVVYLLIGAVGLPVFSGMRGGLPVLVGVTGGFLMAYPLMALAVSLLCRRFHGLWGGLAGVATALFICYALGTGWFMVATGSGLWAALTTCVLPFIPFDVTKGVCAVLLARALQQRVK